MWARMTGIKIVQAKGRVYAYHRATGKRLRSPPLIHGGQWVATPELLAEVAALEKTPTTPKPGSVSALTWSYRKSPAFAELSEVTQGDYVKVIDWIRDRAGDESPNGLTPSRAREIRDAAVKAHRYRFGKYVVQVMRVVWQHGVDYGMARDNPWRAVSLPKRPRTLKDANRPWTPAEVVFVLKAAPVGLARAYALALLGFRPSEIPAMSWRALTPKGVENKSRKTAFDALQSIPAALAPVFAGERSAVTIATNARGKPFKTENALYKASGDFLRGLEGVEPGLTMKGLNHTLGTALAERGVDPRTAKDAMQKRTLSTALHYSRRADTRRNSQTALNELGNWLGLENSEAHAGKPHDSGTEKV